MVVIIVIVAKNYLVVQKQWQLSVDVDIDVDYRWMVRLFLSRHRERVDKGYERHRHTDDILHNGILKIICDDPMI